MATLTTSWQNVASYVFQPGTGFKATFYIDAKYTTQSVANNTTSIQTRLNCTVNTGDGSGYGYKFTLTGASTREGSSLWTLETETIMTGSQTVTHNTDGSKTITISASCYVGSTGLNKSFSANVTLPTIKRLITVSSGSDFNDENNPTLTFTNPASFYGIPYLNFYKGGSVAKRLERPKAKYTSPYTWEITEAERNELRQIFNDDINYTVTEGFDTYTSSSATTSIGYNSVSKTFSIINATPDFSKTVIEQNSKVISVLGGNATNYVVQNASSLKFTITPNLKKYATMKNVVITHNNLTYEDTTSPYELIIPVATSSFGISLTDSRSLTGTETYTKTLISYSPVKFNSLTIVRENPTSSNLVFNASITYTQTTFNTTANTVTIQYKVGESGTWNTLSSSQYTIDTANRLITISNLKINDLLSYQSSDNVYLKVTDKLSEYQDQREITKGVPIMEWGEHDVQINGKLYIADENRENGIDVLPLINEKMSGTYSDTEEVVVGKWINGKPIYRKVVWFNNKYLSNGVTHNHNISNIDMILPVVFAGIWNIGAGELIPFTNSVANSGNNLGVRISKSKVTFIGNDTWAAVSDRYIYIVMEYTKTTDTV